MNEIDGEYRLTDWWQIDSHVGEDDDSQLRSKLSK